MYIIINNVTNDCKKTLTYKDHFICSTDEHKPLDHQNCVIRDIFQENPVSHCPIQKINITGGDYLHEIYPNVWFFFFVKTTQNFVYHCGTHSNIITLNQTGILHLSSSCSIIIGARTIGGNMIEQQQVNIEYRQLNYNLTADSYWELDSSFNRKTHINGELNFKLRNVTLPEIDRDWHDIQHNFPYKIMFYTLFGLITVIILITILFCYCKYCSKTVASAAPAMAAAI